MTDSFEPRNEENTALAGEFIADTAIEIIIDEEAAAKALAAEEAAKLPNGFIALGLADELIQATKEMGFTQPTTVQMKTIPLALPADAVDGTPKKFIDLLCQFAGRAQYQCAWSGWREIAEIGRVFAFCALWRRLATGFGFSASRFKLSALSRNFLFLLFQ